MDKGSPDAGDAALFGARKSSDSSGVSRGTLRSAAFNSNMIKTSTVADKVGAWDGRRPFAVRRTRSWSGDLQDDLSSEVRILRERLMRTQSRVDPRAVRQLSRRQRLTLVLLALVDFLSFCSMSVMAPFFPREAAGKNLSDTYIGLVFSFYAVVMFVSSPLFGKFLPALGAKFLFVTGIFVAGVSNIVFGTLNQIEDGTSFVVWCVVVRGAEALGAAAYSTASYVFVVNAFPDNVGSVLGVLETFVGLGMSVGPAVGGLLYSIGGFGLPFFIIGAIMLIAAPLNFFLLTDCEEYVVSSKSASIFRLFKIPAIIITGLVIVVVSNTWSFLDPTLEPHLRRYNLSTKQIGLIFLLFSGLYAIFSPIWGWLADRVQNHWCMMVWGLLLSGLGLLLLGPCPYIPGLPEVLWLDLVALSILGISVALTLLPTFQGVLSSSIYEGGCPEALGTYSAVAGVWSCCYSLGEVLGPALGGALTDTYGFPLCATAAAAACFLMAIATLVFFAARESSKWPPASESVCESIPYTDSTWSSSAGRMRSAPLPPAAAEEEGCPLLGPCVCPSSSGPWYGSSQKNHICILHNKNKSGSASIAGIAIYILKFEFMTQIIFKLRNWRANSYSSLASSNDLLYQNYLDTDENYEKDENRNLKLYNDRNVKGETNYCLYLEKTIFQSQLLVENIYMNNLSIKRNNEGLVPKVLLKLNNDKKSEDIIRHNLEKIQFYEQSQACKRFDVFDDCSCKDDITYVRGTAAVSSSGACEV